MFVAACHQRRQQEKQGKFFDKELQTHIDQNLAASDPEFVRLLKVCKSKRAILWHHSAVNVSRSINARLCVSQTRFEVVAGSGPWRAPTASPSPCPGAIWWRRVKYPVPVRTYVPLFFVSTHFVRLRVVGKLD